VNGGFPLPEDGKDAKTSPERLVAARMEQKNWTWLLLSGQGVVFFIVARQTKSEHDAYHVPISNKKSFACSVWVPF
jgi:hypothetical protein